MTIFVALLLTVLAFAVIVYPLLRQRLHSVADIEDAQLGELHSRRDTTYSMLKELEFDFESGILSEDDYQELESRYKGKAISILRGIDELESGSGVEEEIEKQVRKLRQRKKVSPSDEALEKEVLRLRRSRKEKKPVADEALEDEVSELRQRRGRFCSQCGAGCQEDDLFCSRCGARLKRGDSID